VADVPTLPNGFRRGRDKGAWQVEVKVDGIGVDQRTRFRGVIVPSRPYRVGRTPGISCKAPAPVEPARAALLVAGADLVRFIPSFGGVPII
jgi:hypothetical protein